MNDNYKIHKYFNILTLLFICILQGCINEKTVICKFKEYEDVISNQLFLSDNRIIVIIEDYEGNLIKKDFEKTIKHRDRFNVKINYSFENNDILIDGILSKMDKLDSIVYAKFINNLNNYNVKFSEIDLRNYNKLSSNLIFTLPVFFIEEKRPTQFYKLFSNLNCSLDKLRERMSINYFKKAYYQLDIEQRRIINNLVPKIFYIIKSSKPDGADL